MSWSHQIGPIRKENFNEIVVHLDHDELPEQLKNNPLFLDQLESALGALQVLGTNFPGPYVLVILSGHANGIGWNKKEGWSNDAINVSIQQIMEDDLKYYPEFQQKEIE